MKSKIKNKLFVVTIFLVMGIIIGALGAYYTLNTKQLSLSNNYLDLQSKQTQFQPLNLANQETHTVYITVPAVDNNNNGVTTRVVVSATPGTGKTLIDVDHLLFWQDTQSSIRTAKEVAQKETGLDLSKYDLVYGIEANASVISGPSAGATLTVATIAALENKQVKSDVLMTGAINHDGTIGPVGGITDKAKAAKAAGATTFLVPLLQGNEVTYETKEYCRDFKFSKFCNIEQVPKKVNVAEEVGIKIVEVQNIKEAMDYFYQ
ncbi:MAG TPA: S16 family serine protease [Candidatus Nanoarchaeia archaeon]|nr:S16 family serine protease [Candidatus Nanoarchaeia archaeon]